MLLGLEAVGLAVLVVWQLMALLAGDTESIDSAIALVVLSIAGVAGVAAFAGAAWRGASWGRSGGIVTQLLILAVAGGAATGAYAHPSTGLILAVPAIIVLVVLVLAVAAGGKDAASADPE
ncbi:histidine kinase [Microbacterium fluvii]|uniref:Histidine kinase n=1 Tax=Microbacterium fluvii TaxID=415215 RepID=A0ABW2HDL5_9MICO|nr:histidine kinase [Microbacterium fluvii]MCU4671479.1 histidine kinase [Microbacterium fluvii]